MSKSRRCGNTTEHQITNQVDAHPLSKGGPCTSPGIVLLWFVLGSSNSYFVKGSVAPCAARGSVGTQTHKHTTLPGISGWEGSSYLRQGVSCLFAACLFTSVPTLPPTCPFLLPGSLISIVFWFLAFPAIVWIWINFWYFDLPALSKSSLGMEWVTTPIGSLKFHYIKSSADRS